jgi:hypothetical protein
LENRRIDFLEQFNKFSRFFSLEKPMTSHENKHILKEAK